MIHRPTRFGEHRTLRIIYALFQVFKTRLAKRQRLRHLKVLVYCNACFLISAFSAPRDAGAGDRFGFELLADSKYSWIEPFLGKVAAMPPEFSYLQDGETCTAVAIAPLWVLTAAHCVHVKQPGQLPWTPEFFAGMYPLERLIFRAAPIGMGPIYRVVDYVKSDPFSDPAAATEDWVYLKLDHALSIDANRAPEVGLPFVGSDNVDMRIPGFVRAYSSDGRLDPRASNLLQVSRKECALSGYRHHLRGAMMGLANADCIPPINLGLSGAPMIDFHSRGHSGRATIVALQMGAGRLAGTLEQVPVLVTSDRFVDAYRRIMGRGTAEDPMGEVTSETTNPSDLP